MQNGASPSLYSTWLEIDLKAIENNVARLRAITGVPVMVVLKANAYGHGLVPVARAAVNAGAAWCAVARVEEAFELRHGGLTGPILLLGYTPPAQVETMIAQQISLIAWEDQQIEYYAAAAARAGKQARLHLKVDTGMGRLGAQPGGALHLARRLAGSAHIHFEGVFTHFARADEDAEATNHRQEELFGEVIGGLKAESLLPPLVHAANSAASLTRPESHHNLVRAGIAVYGLHPSPECLLPAGFQPALAWKTVLSQVRIAPPGTGLSYGHEYTTRRSERIGTLPVGYADGFRRVVPNEVLVGGRRAPVVGRVCMDQCLVQLDGVPEAQAGDEVVLLGAQGEQRITAEQIAARWRTNNYEVACGLAARIPRIYFPNNLF